MNFDTTVFIVAVMATAGELTWLPSRWLMAAGVVLLIAGLLAKYLAFRILGTYGYYWGDFFRREAGPRAAAVKKGIYKYMDNPMYIAGYINAYGWALMWLSWQGLLLAAFYQAAIMAFYFLVERPHFLKTYLN
jgi:phosphatidylethanolamine N-methyltransferase